MVMDRLEWQAELSLRRIMPRLDAQYARTAEGEAWQAFRGRLERHFGDLFRPLLQLYGTTYDFFFHLENLLAMAARMWLSRDADLKTLDVERELNPAWYQSQEMVGGMCYVDLFAETLEGVRARIPYFKELGLTYLHLMPLFLSPAGNNDGGYAISSYRDVNPSLGSMEQLTELAADLRRNGISLVLDFVFNHTSDEHRWARAAIAGDREYADYYYVFPDHTLPAAYSATLRDIFPEQRPGSFTFRPDMGQWVWTTFNSFQWDLNYANPAVFTAMAEEMLFLANRGAEILRLDALAFIWKQMGTSSENLPQAHLLIQALNAVARIASPSLLFKSEAIVHPDEVVKYIGEGECQLSYNPLIMALLWEALATRQVRMLAHALRYRFRLGPCCAWINYVRSHDDIGWTFDDGDAARMGIDAFGHRRFLNDFYTGRFPGSFARGLPFQENPVTGDARVSGTAASLAGLEMALSRNDEREIELSIRRLLLLYSVAFSVGGIPLLYLGDELATLNDYSYRNEAAKAGDNRWVHRPRWNWERVERRSQPGTVEHRVFSAFLHLISLRKSCPPLADGGLDVIDTHNEHVLGYVRRHGAGRVLILANFSEDEQHVDANEVRLYGLGYTFDDLVTGEEVSLQTDLLLQSYGFLWLMAR